MKNKEGGTVMEARKVVSVDSRGVGHLALSASLSANEGVASVDDLTPSVLRGELESFVCEDQCKGGMERILDSYLKNLGQASKPAVWVSGSCGAGKSHFVKVLQALWADTRFDDGCTARSIVRLPQSIRAKLDELSTQAEMHGGLHAASGTLGSSSLDTSARMAVLRVVFRSVGLPEQYQVARFVVWLKKYGAYDKVRSYVEQNGFDWDEELANMYVAEGLHSALVAVKPDLFSSPASCAKMLAKQWPPSMQDVSGDEMTKVIRQVLTRDGKFPLTLVVLDEAQQYVGGDVQRASEVQEVAEACSKNFSGKLLLVCTGQDNVTDANNMRNLEARFPVRVCLE